MARTHNLLRFCLVDSILAYLYLYSEIKRYCKYEYERNSAQRNRSHCALIVKV